MSTEENRVLFGSETEKEREESTKDILKKIQQVNLNHGFSPRNIPGRITSEDKSKQMNYHPQMFSNPVWNYLQRESNSGIKTKIEEGNKEDTEHVPKGHYIKRKITHKQTYMIPNTPPIMPSYDPFMSEPHFDPLEMNKGVGNLSQESQEMTLAKQQFLINSIKNIVSSSQIPQPFSNAYNPYMPHLPYQQFVPYQNSPYYQNPLRIQGQGFNPNYGLAPFSDTYFANLQALKPYDNSRNIQAYDDSKDYGNQDISSQTIKFPNSQNHFRPSRFPGSRQESSRPKRPIITANDNLETQYVRLPDIPKPEKPKQMAPYQNLPDAQITRQFSSATDYFPMNPPEPFKGVYSSITSMVQYGQKDENCDKSKEGDSVIAVRSGKGISFDEFDLELLKFLEDVMKSADQDEDEGEEDKIFDEDEEDTTEETSTIESITEESNVNKSNSVVRVGREISFQNSEKGKKLIKLLEHIREEESKNGPKGIIKYLEKVINETNEEESAFELEGIQILEEESKQPKQLSNKFLSGKDKNTQDDKFYDKTSGSGIFINRLKVRKGGVAIAGPGGIATAGSGGTAIVGPNGVAYTQPNGIAIAGPGSKVIAVDPSVDLNKFVQNLTKNDGSLPRIGKVVAIGPVVYYHKEDKI